MDARVMMERWRSWYRRVRAMKWFSPGSFVLCAATFAGVFLAMHLAGWREKTDVFCGTLAGGREAQIGQSFRAVMYTLFYMATVLVSPILVLAAGVFWGLARWGKCGMPREVGQASTQEMSVIHETVLSAETAEHAEIAERNGGTCQKNKASQDRIGGMTTWQSPNDESMTRRE
jgi:hypothetical protein